MFRVAFPDKAKLTVVFSEEVLLRVAVRKDNPPFSGILDELAVKVTPLVPLDDSPDPPATNVDEWAIPLISAAESRRL